MSDPVPASINVEPHPRLLSVLGDIEFSPVQCIAELVDNSFDEFLRNPLEDEEPTVWVSLPAKSSTPRDGEVWVKDNGPGMTLDQLNNALRAGWTSNDRFGQLGLFGVGFNIATARLGQIAVVRTARADDHLWTVVTLDLKAMAAGNSFDLPVTTDPKGSPGEHGTEIVIRNLKPEHHQTVSRAQAKIKQSLGDIYSYLLADKGFRLIVDNELVKPRLPCVWDESRAVVRSGDRVPAVIRVDERLSDRRVCLDCGTWQSIGDSTCESCESDRVEIRERRIWGWVGIQRYVHASDFGIDFIRNGRKILVRDQSLFRWVDPDDLSDRGVTEYPIEVPRAGRIVGEIHIDHVRVNYQKNAFEYDTPEWKRVVQVVRGEGPLQPKLAKSKGFTAANVAPLARLFNGYRRTDPGLNYLVPGDGKVAIHELAREWADKFRKGDPEYQTDEKWYLAAQQHDKPPAPPVEPTDPATDVLERKGLLGPEDPDPTSPTPPASPPPAQTEDARRSEWRASATPIPDLEASFGLPGHGAALQVHAWLVRGHRITRPNETDPVPIYVASGRGSQVDVFVDGEHSIFVDFGVDTRDLIVIELAEYLRVRDASPRSLSAVFADLKQRCLPDARISGPFLADLAARTLNRVREAMQPVVTGNAAGYWGLLTPEDQAVAERSFAVEGGAVDWSDVIASGEWIEYVSGSALVRLVEARPESFLDGRVFRVSYLPLADSEAKRVAASRLADLLSDVATLAATASGRSPEELQRGRLACLLLSQEIVEAAEEGAA